ncbi:MAG: hypothetical protein J5647_14315 [Spirochaetaceae bacterium]|nr:hypothetical protein [Spirochaetaceae bacterium]
MLELADDAYEIIDSKLLEIEQACLRGMSGNTRLAIMDIKLILHQIREVLNEGSITDGSDAA